MLKVYFALTGRSSSGSAQLLPHLHSIIKFGTFANSECFVLFYTNCAFLSYFSHLKLNRYDMYHPYIVLICDMYHDIPSNIKIERPDKYMQATIIFTHVFANKDLLHRL